ncbi:peptide chain release factor 2 [Desulfobotulus sp. H1]|uniref:Peptide chain release factor 2 n=1 Tax=Desulfobotulus pelophilus TaxID=2823377 RepID=A0ABT3NCY4_9BACT|nr:peptide chain release factor 2 [Desulfobotulus pelophilus]MCW7755056.1 peptide chain release factor 2 [Desulfobotulus pelophilus]
MSAELKQRTKDQRAQLLQLRGVFDLEHLRYRLSEIESIIAHKGFWDNPEAARPILQERTFLSGKLESYQKIEGAINDAEMLLEMAVEEGDEETIKDVAMQMDDVEESLGDLSLKLMLDGEDDSATAIMSINAGAGGTEAQDWAEMLFRMYTRWVERKGFSMQMVDYQPGDEAGIKGVTFTVSGEFAFGYLKTESGVHRLVRISPFNANGKRQTSFASVFVYPEVNQEIEIDIEDKDLRVDVFRASGAGGQHVNKTSSAIRITHLPTGIVVSCQQEKSQHRNREMAMKVLQSRLYQLEKQKQDEKMQEMHDSKGEIAWGSQIRSYVLHPYQMIKDHRTNHETGNSQAVLDGSLDGFIQAELLRRSHAKGKA